MSDLASVLLPIPGAAPAGTNARYEPAFVRLEEQVARLTSLTASAPDWAAVAQDAETVLTRQSKDLLAAVYLTRSWFELRGLPGLRDGLAVVEDLLTTHWQAGFPTVERLRARRGALQWLSDGLAGALTATPDAACSMIVQRLQLLLRPRFADGDTGLGGLLRATVREPLIEVAPLQPAIATSAPAQPTGERDAALARLREAAAWFLLREPHSPVGLLAQRAADLGSKPFAAVFRELLANHAPAQQELWQVLGITSEST